MPDQLQIWKEYPDDEIVVKANELVMSQGQWTTREYRVFVAHVSQLGRDCDSFEPVSVNVKELCDISGVETENMYGEVRDIADRLTDKKIRVERGPRGKEEGAFTNIYAKCGYDRKTGELVGRFTEEMRPYLLKLKEQFTMYYRRNALSMRSTYSMRFYEILKRYEYQGQFKLAVTELRKIFGLEDKYDRFRDLRRRVIDKAQEELAERSDVTFEYTVERQGQKPERIHFEIHSTEDKALLPSEETLNDRSAAAAQNSVKGSKSVTEKAFEELPENTRDDIRQKARKRAKKENPKMGGYSLEAQVWVHVNRIMKEDYL
ncbi:replication initiation protein [Salinibacter ruber]|uniref:replication initiation protein n=1 Tax=Salinibacter ruber TaxID=146919 RepID=UPI000E570C2C|nr:replication initiation protein [Salinibacter ruber]